MATIEYIDYISTKFSTSSSVRFDFRISNRVLRKLDAPAVDDVIVFSIDSFELTELCKNTPEVKIIWSVLQNDVTVDKRIFAGSYNVHQIFLKCSLLLGGSEFVMNFTVDGAVLDEAFDLKIDVGVGYFPSIVAELEEKCIWIFGSPRSGTTWLAHDILGIIPSFTKKKLEFVPGSRPVDEMNIGRIVGGFEIEPESYMYFDSKLFAEYDDEFPSMSTSCQEKIRSGIFKRTIGEGYDRDESIFNERTRDAFIETIRMLICNHIILHWGVEGYERVILKAPNEGHASDVLLRAMPRSRVIHLVRDGRDVIRSRFSPFASKILAETQDSQLRRNAVGYYAHQWNWHTNVVRRACADHDADRVLTIKYEDLRSRNISSFRSILHFAGYRADDNEVMRVINRSALESFADNLKGPDLPRQSGRIGGYRNVFNDVEKTTMTAIMADNLGFYQFDTRIEPSDLRLDRRDVQMREFDGVSVVCSEGFYDDGWVARKSSFVMHANKDISSISIEVYIPKELMQIYQGIIIFLVIKNNPLVWHIDEPGLSRFDSDISIDRNEIFKLNISSNKSHQPSSIQDSEDDRDICMIVSNFICN